MIQKTIRDWGGTEYSTTEGAEQQTEWNDRTAYSVDGYNSIAELGANQAPMKVKTDFITVTQAVNLDTMETDIATNTGKNSYPTADATKVGFIGVTQAVDLDAIETNSDASKVITDWITVTQAVNLDTMESGIATNVTNIALKAPLLTTIATVTENYTTANKTSKTSVTLNSGGAGDTLTLDDTGLSVGFEGQFFNNSGSDVTISSSETILGDNIALQDGAFVYYVLTAANTWQISVGSASFNLADDTTPQLGGELDMQAHSIGGTVQTATGDGTTTIDWGTGNMFDFQFGAFNETFEFTAPAKPGTFILKLVQDSVGTRLATWPATVKWPGGSAPTLTTTATTGTDIVTLYYNGTSYFSVSSLNFS